MHTTYLAYGERFSSDRSLDAFEPLTRDDPVDWSLHQHPSPLIEEHSWRLAHREQDFPGGPTLCIWLEEPGERSLIDYAGWRFLCGASSVTYTGQATQGVGFSEIIERVVAPWMALSRRHDVLALHGSAIARDGRAVVLAGESGAGKSSAALALTRRGFLLYCDDMALIHVPDHAPARVLPGPWVVRMWGERPHDATTEDLGSIYGTHGAKRRVRVRRARTFDVTGVPLEEILLLRREPAKSSSSERGHLSPVRGREAIRALLAQCFDLSDPPASFASRRLRLVAKLAREQSIATFAYRSSADGSPRHVEGILKRWS